MTKLSVGDDAPNFTITDVTGKDVTLSDYNGSYTLIAFLRYSECPWCNLAIHRLTVERPLLADNRCKVIAFIQAPKQNVIDNIMNRHAITPAFAVIPDNDKTIYSMYDVKPNLMRGLQHHLINVPSWVRSVSQDGLLKQKIDSNYFLAPAMFLIAPGEQKIIKLSYTANLYDHDTFTQIYDAIADHSIHQGAA